MNSVINLEQIRAQVHYLAVVRSHERASELALIMHLIRATKRINSKMALILLSIFLAATGVAISMIHTSFGILSGSGIAREAIAKGKERSERSTNPSPTRQFLVVVLPDGKVVSPLVSKRF